MALEIEYNSILCLRETHSLSSYFAEHSECVTFDA